uniref:Uncharacterized protein n=1 Tax=Arundo donax TaxID=35708 RepID=A0A0A9F2U9_ARUDO
MCRTTNLPAR